MGAIFKNSKIVGWLPSACLIRFIAMQKVICAAEKHYYQWDLFLWRPLARAQKDREGKWASSGFTNSRDDASFYFAQNKRAVVNIRPTSDQKDIVRI